MRGTRELLLSGGVSIYLALKKKHTFMPFMWGKGLKLSMVTMNPLFHNGGILLPKTPQCSFLNRSCTCAGGIFKPSNSVNLVNSTN